MVVEPVDDGVDVVLVLLARLIVVAGGVARHVLRVCERESVCVCVCECERVKESV